MILQTTTTPQVCTHIFCDNRVNRAIATYKVSKTYPNGFTAHEVVCSDHLRVLLAAWSNIGESCIVEGL